MPAITVRAPAKVNLALTVGPLRSDGYHDLFTVFHAVSLTDEIVATKAADISITVKGVQIDGVPSGDDNLAVRAARLVAEEYDVTDGVHLELTKAIPVAGGMAGGSADAAAVLIACDAVWGLHLSRADLHQLAARLGSDVPFALLGGTAVGTGRGERLTPALVQGTYHWVFAVSRDGLSTPDVYQELDRLRAEGAAPPSRSAEQVLSALRAGDASALGHALTNDLQAAACSLRPQLETLLEAGEALGALGGIVSGSGPTCAFLVRDPQHGLDLAAGLMATGACRNVRRATGPAPGARIVASSG